MSSPFAVFNNGTVTLIRCNATQDNFGAPKAAYFNEDGSVNESNVIAADIPAQIETHRDRLFGNAALMFDQQTGVGQRDIYFDGNYPELGETGNGNGVLFAITGREASFGIITGMDPGSDLAGMPGSMKLIVKVIEAGVA